MDRTRIIIIGGGYSGVIAARRLALKTRGLPVEITLINASDQFAERLRFHQVAANQVLKVLPMRQMLAGRAMRDVAFLHGKVTRIDPAAHEVAVETINGPRQVAYDQMIYALGSFVDPSRMPGAAENTASISSPDAARHLAGQLSHIAAGGGRVVVCGGGLTGIELASEVAETYPGLDLTLVTRSNFGAELSKAGQSYLRRAFDRLGIDILDNTTITRIDPGEVKAGGASVPFDLCLWAGAFGVPTLARDAGIAVNKLGQVLVDDHLRSISHPEIYAAGDAADPSAAINTAIRMACATSIPMGSYAGDDIAARLRGQRHEAYEFAYYGSCISLGRKDALLQLSDLDDRPLEVIATGRAVARLKEWVCSTVVWVIQHEQIMYSPRRPFWERRAAAPDLAAPAQIR